eukprot:TRINITY_DN63220_c0_g1_i1.p1 TRINITY_DN63220_c0_g1~~TRINITY_DN63220_c0_g1_i1.p1  ORF type:complete len:369 (+),score=77.42 TRINITY_DN63220_c0_g1_i1:84-1190(+)
MPAAVKEISVIMAPAPVADAGASKLVKASAAMDAGGGVQAALSAFSPQSGEKAEGYAADAHARDALGAILCAMRKNLDSPEAQEAGCSLIGTLAAAGPELQAGLASLGAVAAIVDAMEKHTQDEAVQMAGCRALRELAARNVENQAEIASSRGVQAVLTAMDEHRSLGGVQKVGCGVLRNVALANGVHQASIASLGGIPLVLRAMATHSGDAMVQLAGCWTLFCLAVRNATTAGQILAEGGLKAVLLAMEASLRDEAVQEAGCWALKALAEAAPQKGAATKQSLAAELADLGAAEALLRAMAAHPDAANVQKAGRGALDMLAKIHSGGRGFGCGGKRQKSGGDGPAAHRRCGEEARPRSISTLPTLWE